MRLPRLRPPPLRTLFTRALFVRYAVAWVFLAGVAIGDIVLIALPLHGAIALARWASTNVQNLEHHPVAALALSAFLPPEFLQAWLALVALAMFGANRVLGNARLALVCVAGHVIGTAVSEGVVAYRVAHGLLPAAARTIIDIGPSYVAVSAIVVAVAFGSWPARIAALIAFAVLVFVGDIFGGLTSLAVAAIGHVTAMVVAAVLGSVLLWRRRQRAQIRPAA